MQNNTPTREQVVSELHVALSNALDNLPDMVTTNDAVVTECCADIAALAHLVGNDPTGNARILAYL